MMDPLAHLKRDVSVEDWLITVLIQLLRFSPIYHLHST